MLNHLIQSQRSIPIFPVLMPFDGIKYMSFSRWNFTTSTHSKISTIEICSNRAFELPSRLYVGPSSDRIYSFACENQPLVSESQNHTTKSNLPIRLFSFESNHVETLSLGIFQTRFWGNLCEQDTQLTLCRLNSWRCSDCIDIAN